MSKIDRLSISEIIRFGTPLTLIPPNSKGGAFVHDPKLRGDREVLARVGLKLQLTVKKTTRSLKTLESGIRTEYAGDTDSTSNKKVDINKEMARYLGVSPAILEAVIFCHQDESLWPMSEPSALKKRFDEIFEAMKKTKGEQLRELKILESQEKINKEKAEKVEKRCKVKYEAMEEERKEADQNAVEMRQQANSYLDIINNLNSHKRELGFLQKNLEETRTRMDEMDESDDWLRDTLAQYEDRVERYKQDLEANIQQYAQYKNDFSQSRDEMGEKLAEQGMRRSDKEKYERQQASRVELIHEAAQLHNIRGFDGDLDDRKLLADKKRELTNLESQNADELEDKRAAITELENQKRLHTQTRNFARETIGKIEKRIGTLQKDLNSVEVDEGSKALLDSSFKDIGERLEQANQDIQTANFDTKLQEEEEKLQRFEVENSRFGTQLDIHTLSSTWKDKISSMIGSSWEPATIDHEFQKALQLKIQIYDESARRRDDVVQQQKQIQYTLQSSREKAKKRNEEMERCKSAVFKALKTANPDATPSMGDLPQEIERYEEETLVLEKDIALFEHFKNFYSKCQKTLNKQNRCELCDRPFADANDKSRLMKKIQEALQETKKEEMQTELAESEETLGNLRMVRPQSELYARLVSEKEESDKEIHTIGEKLDGMLQRVEEMDEVVKSRQEEKEDLESMGKTVHNISQIYKEIEEAEAQVERIMSQQQSSGAIRSTQEIHELQTRCAEQMKAVKSIISGLSSDRQRMRDLTSSLELERSRLSLKISNANRQLERKQDLQNQIQSQKDDMSKQREAIQQADTELGLVEPEITKAKTIRDDTQQRGRVKEKKVADERDELTTSVGQLKLANNEIQDYLDRGGPSLLAATERAIQSLDNVIKRIEGDMNDLTARTNKIKEDISNSDARKKNIIDNINYRETLAQIEKFKRDIRELESRNANEDFEQLDQEVKSWENQSHMLNAEISEVKGAIRGKDGELKRLLEEWEIEYEGAETKYREAHIKVETTKAVIEDLAKYSTALSNAIMRYHALKMEEVNRIAGELWQSTYQGTDIDTILIKSDSEVTTSTGRSSYNYRVCMVKQDTEMDMRGRCSAGQKVLASIIIRLALAESFGIGCGIIALDEPTTNLDRDNIRSLAESLHAIIEARKAQANFQLIVITHDEEFLRHMRCSDFCDYFYRVKRDDKQNSIIERESITTVV
ncbi:uncharacterized protein F4822DRAFT_436315 [Hypoxylon trugodes]|uniref:uncharacterized protein n=1 Tax=Hypoxylon trugodes TaxID=326681 RepID=UPI002199CD3B|nr:uncharacterized protein F4822DRAFT_436315 [Hypoxylon trugodes]KAI1392848.1 hypothetical protein F4822DRAFT_436315 [Hypoxylon trugodes]